MGNYHPEWTLYDVMVFEALLVLSRSYGNGSFYYQKKRWKKLLRLESWYHIKEKSMEKFITMGILYIEERQGPKKMNFYQVQYDGIINNLEAIYDFSNLSQEDKKGYKGRMRIFFEWWRDHDFNDGTQLTMQNGMLEIKRKALFAVDEEEPAVEVPIPEAD